MWFTGEHDTRSQEPLISDLTLDRLLYVTQTLLADGPWEIPAWSLVPPGTSLYLITPCPM